MKNYRVYYHKRENFPQVWSVDEGNPATEIHVQAVQFEGCWMGSMTGQPGNENEPAGWFAVYGRMEIRGSIATFFPA